MNIANPNLKCSINKGQCSQASRSRFDFW